MKVEEINPYGKESDKGREVEEMFDSISPRYDLMNTAMSLGQHKRWLKKALTETFTQLPEDSDLRILDVATGTGDVVFKMHAMKPDAHITGIDLSEGMLKIAREKLALRSQEEQKLIAFGKGDCLSLPFANETFGMVSVAYGVRNFSDIKRGLKEIHRVMKPGGVFCLIELSTPTGKITRSLYKIYTKSVIPWVGKKITGDPRAYSYLPESIAACPQREEMAQLLKEAGFDKIIWESLSFGALTYYIAKA